MYTSNKGLFISFEGVDGCGKSTQVKLLRDKIGSEGRKVELVREPGGLKISEEIRKILLNPENSAMNFETEALLMTASRAQLTEEVIRPLLVKGFFVIADRFSDSTLAYQGGGRKLDLNILKKINSFATKNLVPDITFLIDIKPEDAMMRSGLASTDRIEGAGIDLQKDVQKTYLSLAKEFSNRFIILDGYDSISSIHSIIWDKIINYSYED
ncbi:MAG: dTMP kinase [Candidatus Marinimicrobia bacterium]|nr:dTMP kinase [Candidatus Neomarinimicrobiota bacterium]